MKQNYRYIFVVLVYKNIDVLEDFFGTLHIKNSHVIVVNSFYDETSLKRCRTVALANKADFIPIVNKGFGYGNNIGVEYAMNNYKFDYLILSNSDIQINDLSYLEDIDSVQAAVIAPYIHLNNGKVQNPNIPWKFNMLLPLLNFAYKYNSRKLLLLLHIYTRVLRELFKIGRFLYSKERYKIYSCHGSFIIFTYAALRELTPLFNENMFLYNEELFLAEKCNAYNIPIYYCPKINILHLEGASSSSNKDISFQYNKQSFEILYNWYKSKKKPNK